jgi:S1-C subfamily serine protease
LDRAEAVGLTVILFLVFTNHDAKPLHLAMYSRISVLITLAAALALTCSLAVADVPSEVLKAEAQRIAAVEKVRSAVVAIFAPGGRGGGSGVLIDADGYALTNYHVVAGGGGRGGARQHMQCGLANGILYDAVLVGIDKVGDVSLIRLLPKKEGDKFPFARLGDSDKVRAGDWSMAMGNPFLLATDFTPTVTFGLVSGVHRYQYPGGSGLLEYTDCIQIETSINPGNSGGPLFNMDGELIGINGRGSFEKRSRVNSGVGYAISINQIKNFLGHLRAGLDTDHASTGFLVEERAEEGAARIQVTSILEDSDARRRGIESGDEILAFAGRPMQEVGVNGYKNVLGTFPRGWRLPLVYRHETERKETLIRLMGVMRREIEDPSKPSPSPEPKPEPKPGPKPGPRPIPIPGPGRMPITPPPAAVLKMYEAKPGFANYYFNKLELERLLKAFRTHGDFSGKTGEWVIEADGEVKNKKTTVKWVIREEKDAQGKEIRTVVRYSLGGVELYELDPIKPGQTDEERKNPPGSGGILVALYQYRQLLTLAQKGFVGEFYYGGWEPFYYPAPEGARSDFSKRIEAEVIVTRTAGVPGKWYFDRADGKLLGCEITILEREDDPCEIYFSDYKKDAQGRLLPQKLEVRYGKERYAQLNVQNLSTGNK